MALPCFQFQTLLTGDCQQLQEMSKLNDKVVGWGTRKISLQSVWIPMFLLVFSFVELELSAEKVLA